jgi:hypothetical protein
MVGAPQGAMRHASQIWQVVFASQTLEVFCLALRKKAQYAVVNNAKENIYKCHTKIGVGIHKQILIIFILSLGSPINKLTIFITF